METASIVMCDTTATEEILYSVTVVLVESRLDMRPAPVVEWFRNVPGAQHKARRQVFTAMAEIHPFSA